MIENILTHWQSFEFTTAIMVFFAYLLIDAMDTYYMQMVVQKRPLAAANIGSTVYILIAFGVLNYVGNFLYVVPMVMGSWVGTYLIIKYDLKHGENRKKLS